MRFIPSDPDIATIFHRILDGDINLQPDFQRGEVWSQGKKQRLIDSILRGWIVPPILVVPSQGTDILEVLDGQQRLASIRDFKLNKLAIDGRIEPFDSSISNYHGLTYANLPVELQKKFDKASIRIFEVTDFLPEEPAEIFFRLNQPTSLTSAEKRNAFFGPVRTQLKNLISHFSSNSATSEVLGFSNSRMAYDEVFARLACTLEQRTLHRKVTAMAIDEMYRRSTPIDDEIMLRVERSMQLLLKIAQPSASIAPSRLSKATAHSWLLFTARLDATGDIPRVKSFFEYFEAFRSLSSISTSSYDLADGFPLASEEDLFRVFNDRASSRVADVSSIVLRDLVLWIAWAKFSGGLSAGCFDPAYPELVEEFASTSLAVESLEGELLDFARAVGWGVAI